jgi:hypothetical protein
MFQCFVKMEPVKLSDKSRFFKNIRGRVSTFDIQNRLNLLFSASTISWVSPIFAGENMVYSAFIFDSKSAGAVKKSIISCH